MNSTMKSTQFQNNNSFAQVYLDLATFTEINTQKRRDGLEKDVVLT